MIIYAPRALDDLRTIEAYLLERNPTAARRVLKQIKSAIEMLAVFPRLGVVVNDEGDRRLGIARCPYLVFYHGGQGRHFHRSYPAQRAQVDKSRNRALTRTSSGEIGTGRLINFADGETVEVEV